MSYNLLFIILSDNIGALVDAALLISVPIGLLMGFIANKLIKIKLVYRIIISIIIAISVAFIGISLFSKIISNI